VLWDANLFCGHDLFDNCGHRFIETVEASAASPNLNWLVKLHPANLWIRELAGVTAEYDEICLIREAVGQLPKHVHLLAPTTPISTLSLFRVADAGITVPGSVGYEMPCFGVPVITAGTGRNSSFGFTLDHDSAEDYLAILARLHTVLRIGAEAIRRAKVHAYALLVGRPWVFKSFRGTVGRDVTDPLCQNLHLAANGFEEIARNGDLATFGDRIERNGSVNYLAADTLAKGEAVSVASGIQTPSPPLSEMRVLLRHATVAARRPSIGQMFT
jgi:hypothetical protein